MNAAINTGPHPAGYTRVEGLRVTICGAEVTEALANGEQIVILGEPMSEDETHNCDFMGCGQCHVLARIVDTTAPDSAEAPAP